MRRIEWWRRTATTILVAGGVLVGWRVSTALVTPAEPPARWHVGTVTASVETVPVRSRGDAADDVAVWRHPVDASLSTIIATDKKQGLMVYDLAGRELQHLVVGEPVNVDLRPGFILDRRPVTIVATGDRRHHRVVLFTVDESSRRLREVPSTPLGVGIPIYGLCMYRDAATGVHDVFITSKNGGVEQWRLFESTPGRVGGARVRTLDVGSQVEGCVADDDLGHLYVGEEDVGIWRYGADPDTGATRRLVDRTGPGGALTADVEGLTIAYGTDGDGYLIASSQGSDQFVLYRRGGDNEPVAAFRVGEGHGIDEVTHADGIDVLVAPLGERFPRGVFVTQDARNDRGRQNFKLVSWQDVETHVLEMASAGEPETARPARPADPSPDRGRSADRVSYVARIGETSFLLAWGAADDFGRASTFIGPVTVRLDGRPVPDVGRRNWIRIDGLEPDRLYDYRVEGAGWASSGTVRTYPVRPERISFLVIGDHGTGSRTQREIGRAMADIVVRRQTTDDPIRFVLTVGDNIYRDAAAAWICPWLHCPGSGDEDRDWMEKFVVPYQGVIASVPFYPTLGNHDGNASEEAADLDAYVDNFFLADRQPTPRYYHVPLGDLVELFALDTTRNAAAGARRTPMHRPDGPQIRWLETALAQSAARWKIPFFHHPPVTAGPHHAPSGETLRHLVDLFETHGVQVVFTGHEHNLQVFESSARTGHVRYIVTGGGGGVREGPPDRTSFRFKRQRSVDLLESWSTEPHVLLVDVGREEIEIRAVGRTGAVLTLRGRTPSQPVRVRAHPAPARPGVPREGR